MLLFLIFALLGYRVFVLPNQNVDTNSDFSDFQTEISAFQASLEKRRNHEKMKRGYNEAERLQGREKPAELFQFDPNTLPYNEWIRLGISERVARIIENYRQSGGVFHVKEDLKKIYGLEATEYKRIEPYIQIPPAEKETRLSTANQKNMQPHEEKNKAMEVPLNASDTFELMMVHGVGPAFARGICKYRDLLGGYVSVDQLKEVYGIHDSVYQNIKGSFIVDTANIRQISLNQATFRELVRHPYLSSYQTKAILNYRQFQGEIYTTEELLENNILDPDTYQKMRTYLVP